MIALVRIAGALAIAAALSSCVASSDPLFDPATAVTPLRPGPYILQEYVVGHWLNRRTGNFSLAGSTYTWSETPSGASAGTAECPDANAPCPAALIDDPRKFTLHDIGGGLFAAMVDAKGDGYSYVYELAEMTGDGLLRYGIDCDNVKYLREIASFGLKTAGMKCLASNAGGLKNLLRSYAMRSFPKFRYVRQGQ